MKKAVRARDDFKCTACGVPNGAHIRRYGKSLHVHRVVPGSRYEVDGCVTLCIPCHGPQPRRARGQRRQEEPWVEPTFSFPADWWRVAQELAADRPMPALWLLVELVKREAEARGKKGLPSLPWAIKEKK